MADVPAFTPVNLITGFLGSGKTTLLRRLLDDAALVDTAVLINEFGEIGLDHHLLGRIDETMVLLPSGCLCCTIRGELSAAIRDLHERRERGEVPPFRRLAIESTGLADPFPILSTVQADPVLRHHFRWGNVVTTVDAVNGRAQFERRRESTKQAAVADRLVLTKTDLADAAEIEALIECLRRLNPRRRWFVWPRGRSRPTASLRTICSRRRRAPMRPATCSSMPRRTMATAPASMPSRCRSTVSSIGRASACG